MVVSDFRVTGEWLHCWYERPHGSNWALLVHVCKRCIIVVLASQGGVHTLNLILATRHVVFLSIVCSNVQSEGRKSRNWLCYFSLFS